MRGSELFCQLNTRRGWITWRGARPADARIPRWVNLRGARCQKQGERVVSVFSQEEQDKG